MIFVSSGLNLPYWNQRSAFAFDTTRLGRVNRMLRCGKRERFSRSSSLRHQTSQTCVGHDGRRERRRHDPACCWPAAPKDQDYWPSMAVTSSDVSAEGLGVTRSLHHAASGFAARLLIATWYCDRVSPLSAHQNKVQSSAPRHLPVIDDPTFYKL